jgi:hypothetical protein
MISHTKASDNLRNISYRYLHMATPFVFLLLLLIPGLFILGDAAAQQALKRPANTQDETGETKADFLFEKPGRFLGFRMGRFFPRAGSDLFDMVTRELTLEKSDLQAWDFGVEGGISLHERFDLVFGMETSKRTKNSEFRYYIDEQGMPITQTTIYSQTPLTVGIRFFLMPPGRQVGQYAWLPSRIVPYAGGGGGFLWYRFKQDGDFVDVTTLEIFSAELESTGCVPTIYLEGGAAIHLLKSTYLTLDLRYSWANDELEGDFVGFDPIDLRGLRLTAGVHWRF